MSARSDSQSTPDQQPGDPHGAERVESTIAWCSPTILCDVRPRATNLVPTPPNKQPKSSCIWRHGEAVTDLKDDLNKWLCRLCYEEPSQKLGRVLAMRTYEPANPSPRTMPWIRQVRRQARAEAFA
jgi:hypothetical protein